MMPAITYFVVQPFERGTKARYLTGEPVEARSADHAVRIADRYAKSQAGAIAFSRKGDPELGDWDDAVVLKIVGDVPDEALSN